MGDQVSKADGRKQIGEGMVLQSLSQAKAWLMIRYPFYGYLLANIDIHEDNNQPTAYTNGKEIGYNKAFMEGLKLEHVMFVLAHEMGHIVFRHIGRRHSKRPIVWNVATDLVINDLLVRDGFSLIPHSLYDQDLSSGKTADQVYADLLKKNKTISASMVGSMSGPENHDKWRESNELEEAEMMQRVAEAAAFARAMGKLPGHMQEVIDKFLKPVVDPYTVLQEFIAQSVLTSDYRLFPPNKKYSVWLPSLKKQEAIEGCVVLDTSGSMGDDELAKCLGWIQEITEQFGEYTIRYIQCDAAVQADEIIETGQPFPKKVKGRGGTDFRPPFKLLDRPQFVVYMTDGYGQFPEQEPDYPVIWLLTGDTVVPWGKKAVL